MVGLVGYEDSDEDEVEEEELERQQKEVPAIRKGKVENQKRSTSTTTEQLGRLPLVGSMNTVQKDAKVGEENKIEKKKKKKKKKKAKLDISSLPLEIQEALSRSYHGNKSQVDEDEDDDDLYDVGIFNDISIAATRKAIDEGVHQDQEIVEEPDKNTKEEKSFDRSKIERLARLREQAQLEKQKQVKEQIKSKTEQRVQKSGLFALLPNPSNSFEDIAQNMKQDEAEENKEKSDKLPAKGQKRRIERKEEEEEEEEEEEQEESQGLLINSLYTVSTSQSATNTKSLPSNGRRNLIHSRPSDQVPQLFSQYPHKEAISSLNILKGKHQIIGKHQAPTFYPNLPLATSSLSPTNVPSMISESNQVQKSGSKRRKLRDLEREIRSGNISNAANQFTEIQAPSLNYDPYSNGEIQIGPDIQKPMVETLVYDATSGQTVTTTEVGKKHKSKNQLNTLMLRAMETSNRQQVLGKNK